LGGAIFAQMAASLGTFAFLGGAIFAQMAASLGTFVSSLLVFAASLTLCVAVYSRRVRSVVFSALQRAAKLLGFRSLPED